ncbi:aldo/keto reductase [Granulicella paludicola]|uniref:aldo/keto reductase n=1 Tax=Granulicella paludicola TaxID=474951 RepID=UPI0021DFB902|nr:aldo/keto reductase [Granulicella paludicola]
MNFRSLGRSGLKVPELCFGTGTFGGTNDFFKSWGSTQDKEAEHLLDICMEEGCNFFDTADIYSDGHSEEVLGRAMAHLKREDILISTKATFRGSNIGANNVGSSRYHLTQALEASLKRLKTDYVDVYHMHAFDATTPVEETLKTLDNFITSGKVRYIAASNFSGWHLMKSLSASERYGWSKYVGHQVYYSLVGRDYEWELMPLAVDQGVGALVWSPLGWGRLTGKIRRGQPLPENSRLQNKTVVDAGPNPDWEHVYKVVDALDLIATETGKTVPQISLNWLLQRPTISTLIIGARDEKQLRANLASTGWNLTPEQVAKLDAASAIDPAYPYWHQVQFTERNPFPTNVTYLG